LLLHPPWVVRDRAIGKAKILKPRREIDVRATHFDSRYRLKSIETGRFLPTETEEKQLFNASLLKSNTGHCTNFPDLKSNGAIDREFDPPRVWPIDYELRPRRKPWDAENTSKKRSRHDGVALDEWWTLTIRFQEVDDWIQIDAHSSPIESRLTASGR
jgi:hypothetical protein